MLSLIRLSRKFLPKGRRVILRRRRCSSTSSSSSSGSKPAAVGVLNPDLPAWNVEDLQGLLNHKDWRVSDVKENMAERLSLNPTVTTNVVPRTTAESRKQRLAWKRESAFSRDREMVHGSLKVRNFDKDSCFDEKRALNESARCLKCADAPCTKSCPASVDVKGFVQCMSSRNYYGAAKAILSDNPIGLSCASVCPTAELCKGSCNLAAASDSPLEIGPLQEFACAEFMKWGVKQLSNADNSHPAFSKKVSIIGAGPASLSCANFLGRLGYKNVTVYEKSALPGGLSTSEIPQFRCHLDGVRWEARLCEDLGVKFKYGTALGSGELPSLEALRETSDAVFVGIGLDKAKRASCFEGLSPEQGLLTSKQFLPAVASGSKLHGDLPSLKGHVLVLGAGDTALDCATSAFRVGASAVTCAFRKSWSDMRASYEEREDSIRQLVDFLPLANPCGVQRDESGHVTGVQFQRSVATVDSEKPWTAKSYPAPSEETFTVPCDTVVLAFGCELSDESLLAPMEMEDASTVRVNELGQSVNTPWLFAGGDIVGSTMTVEAVNDGKNAALGIHKFLQGDVDDKLPRTLPLFETAIDSVDVSVQMAGVDFVNPFGLASAPCCTSAHMIRRAFEQGWAFAVTKTFAMDHLLPRNVSPRIYRTTNTPRHLGPHQIGFANIELISEKSAAYWCKTIDELKRDFPDRVMVASIMAPENKEEWQQLTAMSVAAGADMVELNLSCPQGMHEEGMGLECGVYPDVVERITSWCVEAAKGRPVFVKCTPNITDITTIALGAQSGGALGVTAINTLSGIMDLDLSGKPWPKVGSASMITAGGMCGDQNRPVASRMICQIRKSCGKDFAIMGTGGVSSADSTVQLMRLGASVVQIASAIQNQDYTVVGDYISGLKAYLYRLGRGDFEERHWQNGWPAGAKWLQKIPLVEAEPRYGDSERRRVKEKRSALLETGAITDESIVKLDDIYATADESLKAASVQSIIDASVHLIGEHSELSRKEQVVAVINDDLCVQCGKCYQTCSDNGYQAIKFDGEHKATVVTADCTGCALCQSVCPVPSCIQYEEMPHEYQPHRGIKPVTESESSI